MLPIIGLLNRDNVRDIYHNPFVTLFIFGYNEKETDQESMFYFNEFPKHHKEKPQISFILSRLKGEGVYHFNIKYGKEQHFRVASSLSGHRPNVHRIIRNKEADPSRFFSVEEISPLIKQLLFCSDEQALKLAEFCIKLALEGKRMMKRDIRWINNLHREGKDVKVDVVVVGKLKLIRLKFGNIETTQYMFPKTVKHIAKLLDIRSKDVVKDFIKNTVELLRKAKKEGCL